VLNIGKCTLLGNYRENNEDAIDVKQFPDVTICMVADGMGGQQAGEIPSKQAVEVLPRELKKNLGSTTDADETKQLIRKQRKRDGGLVCNIQMDATSPNGVASRIANQMPCSRMRNTMSSAEFSALLKSSGFTVERVTAYGYLPRPGRLLPQLCEASIEPAERVARALRIPSLFAQQLLFVAKRG
jgi:hypothetical protein